MKLVTPKIWLVVAVAAALTLAGCGGGGGSDTVATTTAFTTTVIDGAIKNAVVCLDKNSNGLCDVGEPQGKTDVAGNATFSINNSDIGKYPVLAIVGTDATDADTGAIATAYTMTAPADRPTVVSPLTTMVQQTIATTGASSADAAASVQNALGLSVSVFQDYTKATAPTDGTQNAATVARMVVVTTQQQSAAIASTLGTSAADSAVITKAMLDQAIQKKLLELLPAIVAALSQPTVLAAAPGTAREAALLAAASALVTSSGLTSAGIPTVIAINNQTSATAPAVAYVPTGGLSLTSMTFTDSLNFYVRALGSTLAQDTPDANGKVKYVERRLRSTSGVRATWGAGGSPARNADLSWNGTAWSNCPINFENTQTPRDANGNSTYNYCGDRETGKSNRAVFDVSGQLMASVYSTVRAAGYTNLDIANPSTVLGTTAFPTGSKLYYQTAQPLTTAVSYYPSGANSPVGESNTVNEYSAAVVAAAATNGGVAASQPLGTGCNSTELNTNGTNSTTLEGMIASRPGNPCSFTGGSFVYNGVTYINPDTTNESWGPFTLSLGTIGTVPTGTGVAPGYYSGNTRLRVAFKGTGANAVTYYACKERFNNGSARNCTQIGTGSYTIATLGDARTMTFNNLPAQATQLSYSRVFVERGGRVFYGYKSNLNVSNTARFNKIGTDALLTKLGIPTVDPAVPLTLTAASFQGIWDAHDTTRAVGTGNMLTVAADGTVTCKDTTTLAVYSPCAWTVNPATGAFSTTSGTDVGSPTGSATGTGSAIGTVDFLTGSGSGTYTNTNPSGPPNGSFVIYRR